MRISSIVLLLALTTACFAQAPAAAGKPTTTAAQRDEDYKPGPDSQRQPGVPAGKTFSFKFESSKIFPGTTRSISVYIPAQYKADKPACVYIALDGLGFDAPIVFDNLIEKKDMPITIGVGVSPGQVNSADSPNDPRFNRSYEFDGLNDSLARCLLEEILPEVEKHKTQDGLPILLSKNPNDRCTAGGSTGAIAAFTLAWERPDQFRRVFSAIGTYVGMRGGDRYPVLVRKTEPKPIRIFMQDGSNDEWGGGPEVGDWWMSNQTLERALEFSGYQVDHVWGIGPHSGRHATAIFPDAMRFLWKDYPQPITAGKTQNIFLKSILLPDETWRELENSPTDAVALAADAQGELFYLTRTGAIQRPSKAGEVQPIADHAFATGFAFGPEKSIYSGDSRNGYITKLGSGAKRIDVGADHLFISDNGFIYATETGAGDTNGKLWLVRAGAEKLNLDSGLNHPTGVALSPDHMWLAVLERTSHWGYSYRVAADGTVSDKQKFYWLHVPDWADDSGAGAICFDRDGRLYAATKMGVQVLDRNGRVRGIMPMPGNAQATGLCFGGANFDELYVAAEGKIFHRKLHVAGLAPASAPIKLPPWGAG